MKGWALKIWTVLGPNAFSPSKSLSLAAYKQQVPYINNYISPTGQRNSKSKFSFLVPFKRIPLHPKTKKVGYLRFGTLVHLLKDRNDGRTGLLQVEDHHEYIGVA